MDESKLSNVHVESTLDKNRRRTIDWDEFGNEAMVSLGRKGMFTFVKCMPNLTTVFVGSGAGHFPAYYEQITKRRAILIDPAPGSFRSLMVHRKPHYPTVHELLADQHMLGGLDSGYIACINWSDPNMPESKGTEPYDMEFIRLLRPPHLLLIFEPSGGAGSTALLAWLKLCGVEYSIRNGVASEFTLDQRHANIGGYREVARTVKYIDAMGCTVAHTMLWMTRLPNIEPCAKMSAIVAKNPPDPVLTDTDLAYDNVLAGGPVSVYDQLVVAGDMMNVLSHHMSNNSQTETVSPETKALQVRMANVTLGMIKMIKLFRDMSPPTTE